MTGSGGGLGRKESGEIQTRLAACEAEVRAGQSLVQELAAIGTALSGEKDHERLLERIVAAAKRYTHADGCTLYTLDERSSQLVFKVVRNDSLGILMGTKGEEIPWDPVPLRCPDGCANHHNVSAHCALTGSIIKIADVYDAEFDFRGTREFDARSGYRSKSMLVLPMRDHRDDIIGVIQLLNALDVKTGQVVDFSDHEIGIVASLASQAAIAITNNRLIHDLEELLEAIVRMVATAIDEKSPYTAGHVQRVAEITEALAQEINASSTAPFADVVLRPDELKELRMAAWLHDVGKIVTPEHVIDKATKLETIFDRIELVRHRVELERKEREIAGLAARVRELEARCGEACVRSPEEAGDDDLSDDFAFLLQVNRGGEFLQDASIERIRGIGRRQVRTAHGDERLLTEDEMRNLSVRKGTLTDEEREIINNHVAVTIKMLDRLPFPKQYAGVPRYAGMHHEKLDGTGYPLGVGAAALPLQARILAVADVFEALTAADRPYKHGKKLSESMKIMGFMARDGHLDPDLCDLIVTSGFVERYAARVLPSHQRNAFEWKGKVYGRNFAQE